MGITIDSYPVYDNLTSIPNVYLNIRDIKTTKEKTFDISNLEKDIYKIEFLYNIKKDNKHIFTSIINASSETAYTDDLWSTAYTLMKEDLTSKGFTFSDNL